MSDKACAIIQARTGSTRLPGKILRDFYQGRSILDLIINRLNMVLNKESLHVATTIKKDDHSVQKLCQAKGINCYRGEEQDVLKRIINTADSFNCKKIIRVCADNPFINLKYLRELLKTGMNNRWDYICHTVSGVPAMQTHYGLFVEYVTREALKKIYNKTTDPVYKEHVTNYIYTHEKEFSIKYIPADELTNHPNLRLTIDTPEDFKVCQQIYAELKQNEKPLTINNIILVLEGHPKWKKQMEQQVARNKK